MAEKFITANVVVEFGDGDDEPNVLVEIDSREDGLNNGITSFKPGDEAYLLLYVPEGWECKPSNRYISAGTLSAAGTSTVEIEKEFLVFVDDEEVTLQYPPSTFIASGGWLGANLGDPTVDKQTVRIPKRTYNQTTKKFTPEHRIGVFNMVYESEPMVFKVSNVPVTITNVGVLFVVTKIPTP